MRGVWIAIALAMPVLARSGPASEYNAQDGTPPVSKPEATPPKPAPPTPQDPTPKPKPDAETQKTKSETESAKLKSNPDSTLPKSTAPAPTPEPSKVSADTKQEPSTNSDRVVLHDQTPATSPMPSAPAPHEAPAPPADTAATPAKALFKLDGSRPLDASGYSILVQRLVLEFPDLLRAQSLGKSRSGRDLWLLTASDFRSGDPSQKPAVCVCSDLPSSAAATTSARPSGDASRPQDSVAAPDARPAPVASPEAALFLIAKLLSDSRTTPELAALLQESTLYVLPAMDPEQACTPNPSASEPAPRACHLDRNFPVDWQPWGDEPGAQGPYPLSEPESQCIALFLSQRSNVSAVVVLSRDGRRLVQPSVAPESARETARETAPEDRDQRACARVCAMASLAASDAEAASHASENADAPPAPRLHPPDELVRHGGDFTSFCEEFVGLSVFTTSPWLGAPTETPLGPAPAGFETSAALVERVLKALPRLATDAPKVERLRNNLWMIDIGVHNQGILPTLSARLRGRGAAASVSLKTSGAKLIAVAMKRRAESAYEALRPQDGGAQIGHLEGEESFNLRVLVEAPENTTVEMTLDSQRAGQKRIKVALQ